MDNTVTLEWGEVKELFLRTADGDYLTRMNKDVLRRVRGCWANVEWAGGTLDQTREWLRDGYHHQQLALSPLETAPRQRRRFSWGCEDGEPDPSRILGGADDLYLERCSRPAQTGLTVRVGFGFGARVGAATIAKYGAWVASLLGSLEAEGYDLEVTVSHYAQGVLANEPSALTTTHVQVKRPNELSDFSSWSALFSPTGWRHLYFMAIVLTAERLGRHARHTLGVGLHREWAIRQDGSEITIEADYGGSKGGVEILNTQARELGLIQ